MTAIARCRTDGNELGVRRRIRVALAKIVRPGQFFTVRTDDHGTDRYVSVLECESRLGQSNVHPVEIRSWSSWKKRQEEMGA